MISKEDFRLLVENMRQRYNSLQSPIHCKALNQKVVLNAKGFHHLLYDGAGKARTIVAARSKLVLIPLISAVLRKATDSSYEKLYARKNRKKTSPSILVEMWGLEAEVGQKSPCTVRVILRREGNGHILFWSVMKIK